MKIEFTVPGIPLARKAHRIIRLPNGRPKPILHDQSADFQNLIKLCAKEAMQGRPPLDCMVSVYIGAYWPMIKSLKKAQKERLKNAGSIPYPKRADADNVAKNVLDGLKGIAITDDKLVVALHVEKFIRETPGTEITIFDHA